MSFWRKQMADPTPEQLEHLDAKYRADSSGDFLLFLHGLHIPVSGDGVLFASCMADFQRECFEELAPSIHAIRDGAMPPIRRWWIERTKKAAKDADLAIILVWLMAFALRPLLVQVCAANQKQARIIEDRVVELLHWNSWLNEHVEVVQSCIRNRRDPRKVRTQIEATGSAGDAQGPTPDLLILNELVHVDRWSVMEAHMNNAGGVPSGVAIVSTNAG